MANVAGATGRFKTLSAGDGSRAKWVDHVSPVFISYAMEDAKAASLVAEALTKAGYSLALMHQPPLGASLASFASKQIIEASCVIALWSPVSCGSAVLLAQARLARARGKLVDVKLCAGDWAERMPLHAALELLHWLDNAVDISPWVETADKVSRKRFLDRVATFTRLNADKPPSAGNRATVSSKGASTQQFRGRESPEIQDSQSSDAVAVSGFTEDSVFTASSEALAAPLLTGTGSRERLFNSAGVDAVPGHTSPLIGINWPLSDEAPGWRASGRDINAVVAAVPKTQSHYTNTALDATSRTKSSESLHATAGAGPRSASPPVDTDMARNAPRLSTSSEPRADNPITQAPQRETVADEKKKRAAGLGMMPMAIVIVVGSILALYSFSIAWNNKQSTLQREANAAAAWAEAQRRNTQAAYEAFIADYPDNHRNAGARAALSALARADAGATRRSVVLSAYAAVKPKLTTARSLADRVLVTLVFPTAGEAALAQGIVFSPYATDLDRRESDPQSNATVIEDRVFTRDGGIWDAAGRTMKKVHAALDDAAFAAAENATGTSAYGDYLAAFPNGRHRDDARSKTVKAALPTHDSEPNRITVDRTAKLSEPFAAARLHPDVAAAVQRARDAADTAGRAAEAALSASQRAKQSAARAHAGVMGYGEIELQNGDVYSGEMVDGRPQGYGVSQSAPSNSGVLEYYAGAHDNGLSQGLGVYAVEEAGRESIVYAGEWSRGTISGRGVMNLGGGVTVTGEFLDGRTAGVAIAESPEGRYEGEWRDDNVDGLGVLWNLNGEVQLSGRWREYQLTQPLER